MKRLSLHGKFLLVVLPVFCVVAVAGLGMWWRLEAVANVGTLSQRVGSQVGRISSALDRVASLPDNGQIVDDFLGTFGSDGAVLCAELLRTDAGGGRVGAYPPVVGCKGIEGDLSIQQPLDDGRLLLLVRYSDAEVAAATRHRTLLALGVLLAALAAALLSASVGYGFIIGRRLKRLHGAITHSAGATHRVRVPAGAPDELGDIITAYNRLMDVEQAREFNLKAHAQQLDDASRRDPLTHLYNRRHFEEWVNEFNGQTVLKQLSGVIGLIDVDHFKKINDTWGHGVGDEVLVELARRLEQSLRQEDFLVRWGGEEILVYCANQQNPRAVARRLLATGTLEPFATAAGPVEVTASIGLACLPLAAGDFVLSVDRVIRLADNALYLAKHRGRAQAVCIQALMLERPEELSAVEEDLQDAAERGRVSLSTLHRSDVLTPRTEPPLYAA